MKSWILDRIAKQPITLHLIHNISFYSFSHQEQKKSKSTLQSELKAKNTISERKKSWTTLEVSPLYLTADSVFFKAE